MKDSSDSRYPYTYAADFVREHCQEWETVGGYPMRIPSVSRSQASRVMEAFEKVFGLTHEEMACKIADYAAQEEDRKFLQQQKEKNQ